MAVLPNLLLCMFAYTSNIRMGRSRCAWLSPDFFKCMSRSSPSLNYVGDYTEHQVKLDAIHPISAVSMLVASVFTTTGVNMEGPEDVFSISLLVSSIYLSKGTGAAFYGRVTFTLPSWSRYDCVNLSIPSRLSAWPRSKILTKNVIPLYWEIVQTSCCVCQLLPCMIF